MKVTFNLSDADLKYFRKVMQEVRQKHKRSGEEEIVESARALIDAVQNTTVPDFITERIEKLVRLIDMLEDEEWALAGRDRERVVHGMAYFAEPDDMIPDKVPVLGFLDDAIMVELVVTELEHELQAYEDFCEFRQRQEERFGDEDGATREEWLSSRRRALHQRMRRRRSRRKGRARSSGSKSPISLW